MPARLTPILALLATTFLTACGGSSNNTASTASTPAATDTTATTPDQPTAPGCEQLSSVTPPGAQTLSAPKTRLDAAHTYIARMTTNCGEIDFKLDVKRAPKTAASFASLARKGFYDGLTFHRIANSGSSPWVIQGGDPNGNGSGGPGYSVVEPPPKSLRYTRGVVAMAKGGNEAPGTSGSQFFIVTAQDANLPPDYALLGKVVKGDKVLSRLAAAPFDPQTAQPLSPLLITQIKIVER